MCESGESKSTMEAIREDIAELISGLYKLTAYHPICLHYQLAVELERARKALNRAHDETIRIEMMVEGGDS